MIEQQEYDRRVKFLIPQLIAKGKAVGNETKELYALYNDRFTPKETNTWCSGCRARVFKKMVQYYESIKDKTNGTN